jgi:hypothetical protein
VIKAKFYVSIFASLGERMDLILKVLELDLEVGHAGGRVPDDDRLQLPPEVLGTILLLAVEVLTQPTALLL